MELGKTNFEITKQRLWSYFAVMVVFWIVSTIWWVSMGYEGTFRWLNQLQSSAINYSSFYFFTNLADGIILPGLILLFFWRKDPAFAITFVVAFIFTGGITQVAKHFLFDDAIRPTMYFQFDQSVDIFVNKVQTQPPVKHSFPSGHATSVATGGIFFAWGMYDWKKWLPSIVGLFTVFLCFTRVFLGVHFPADIFVGSVIGSLGGLLILMICYPIIHNRLHGLQRIYHPTLGKVVFVIASLLILGEFLRLAIG